MHEQGVSEFPYYVGINSLSDLATKNDKVVVLNILGKESSGVTPISNDYSGGNIVFGTGPGKSGKFLTTRMGKSQFTIRLKREWLQDINLIPWLCISLRQVLRMVLPKL